MTNPFATTVGLKGVTDGSPPVWVNDLPGMSTELVEAVADSEDVDTDDETGAETTWARIQRLAMEKLLSMVEGELSKSADFVYDIVRTGLPVGEATDSISPTSYYVGVVLGVPYGPFQKVFIDYVALSADILADVSGVLLTVSDLLTGAILSSKTLTIHQGYNGIDLSVDVPMSFAKPTKLFVGVRCDDLTLAAFPPQTWESNDSRYTLEPAMYPPGHGKLAIPMSSYGIGIQASVRNDFSLLIKRHEDRLRWAYAHICGSLLLQEKLASPRMNLFTNTNRIYTEEQEPRLLEEAKCLVRPVCRTILKELAGTPVVTASTDRPYDAGYTQGSFV